MSESAPRSNPRIDNFEANKLAHEQKAFEDSLYGDAGTTDFSDEAKRRVDEADTYERHLEKLQGRPTDADIDGDYSNPYMDNLHTEALEINAEYDAAQAGIVEAEEARITNLMQSDKYVRQMQMIARDIARIGGTAVTPENDATLSAALKDKEDRLQELLVKYSEESLNTKEDVDTITSRIINMTVAAPAATEASDDEEKSDDDSDSNNVGGTSESGDSAGPSNKEGGEPIDVAPLEVTDPEDVMPVVEPLEVAASDEGEPINVAPLEVASAGGEEINVAPLEVAPAESYKGQKLAEMLDHPAITTRKWMRERGDKLKARLDKFRGRSTKEKALIIGAGIGVAAVGFAIYQIAKQGGDTSGLNSVGERLNDLSLGNSLGNDVSEHISNAIDHAQSSVGAAAEAASGNFDLSSLSPEALTAHRGEGWEQQLMQMGFTREELPSMYHEMLTSDNPVVQKMVYQMSDGLPGMSQSGRIPDAMLQWIMKMRG